MNVNKLKIQDVKIYEIAAYDTCTPYDVAKKL